MKNGSTSKRNFWNDIKSNQIRPLEEYEFITSATNYRETKEILLFLNEYSKNGVGSVSQIISIWEIESIHTILHVLCRYDIHPDHWVNLVEKYQSRPDKSSVKSSDFLKQHRKLWGERAVTPRQRGKSLSFKELKEQNCVLISQVEEREEELNEYLDVFDVELEEKDQQIQRAKEQLEADVNELDGIEFEKELMMKDKNGNADDLGWYKLDEYRRVKDQLFDHFKKNEPPQVKIPIKDKIKALSES